MKRVEFKIPQDRGVLYDLIRYPAGEVQIRLTKTGMDAVAGKDEYEIKTDRVFDVMELAQLKDAIEYGRFMKDGGHFWYKHLFMRYLPYSRADRRFVPGDTFGLGVFASVINSLGFTAVWTFDVHSDMADFLFRTPTGDRTLCNMKPTDEPYDEIGKIIDDIRRTGLVLIAPDKGARSRYDLDRYKLKVVDGEKKRDATSGALSGFGVYSAHEDLLRWAKKGLIVDDICDGGGTFIGLAEAIKKINPRIKLYLYVSHGIFSKGFGGLSQVFDDIYTSRFSFQGPGQEEPNRWEDVK